MQRRVCAQFSTLPLTECMRSTDSNATAPTNASEDATKLSSTANDAPTNAGESNSAESNTDAAGEAGENGADGGANPPAPVDPNAQLTIRALVSTKEAGVIIGKGGQNVAELREKTGVKAGVSKVVPGVHDRVLSVSGTMEGIAHVSLDAASQHILKGSGMLRSTLAADLERLYAKPKWY